MTTFELYDADEYQLLASYDSEAAAVNALLASHEASGDWAGIERLALARTTDEVTSLIAEGQDLAKYLLEHGRLASASR